MAEELGSLMRATRALFENDNRTLEQISKGSGLPFYWLIAFKEHRSANPSVNRIQKLYEFLSGQKLSVSFQPLKQVH